MNRTRILIGALICLYAMTVFALRLMGKDKLFRKLGPMRDFWGPRLGSTIHYFGYVLVPLAIGIGLIITGMNGGTASPLP